MLQLLHCCDQLQQSHYCSLPELALLPLRPGLGAQGHLEFGLDLAPLVLHHLADLLTQIFFLPWALTCHSLQPSSTLRLW